MAVIVHVSAVSLIVLLPLDSSLSTDIKHVSSQLSSFRHYIDTSLLLCETAKTRPATHVRCIHSSGVSLGASPFERPGSLLAPSELHGTAISWFASVVSAVLTVSKLTFAVVAVGLVHQLGETENCYLRLPV